jgi:hypothetical protein
MQHKPRPKSRLLNTKVDKRDVTYTSGTCWGLKQRMINVWWGPGAVNDGSRLIFFSKIVGDFSRKCFRNVFVNFDFYNINCCNILILILKIKISMFEKISMGPWWQVPTTSSRWLVPSQQVPAIYFCNRVSSAEVIFILFINVLPFYSDSSRS